MIAFFTICFDKMATTKDIVIFYPHIFANAVLATRHKLMSVKSSQVVLGV